MAYERQRSLPVTYKGVSLECGYRIDLVVERQLLVELKCVGELMPIHEAQILTYLKLTGLHVGLLVNFNTPTLRHGIRRLVRHVIPAASAETERDPARGPGAP